MYDFLLPVRNQKMEPNMVHMIPELTPVPEGPAAVVVAPVKALVPVQPTDPNELHPVVVTAAAGGVVGSVVMLITLTLAHFNWTVPGEGTAAMMVVLTPILHWLAIRMNK